MTVDELRREKGGNLRMRFLQVDSQHKCIPGDWYILGYDTFAVYTFLRLITQSDFTGGEVNPEGYLRPYLNKYMSQ
jgi:hypothetical protein